MKRLELIKNLEEILEELRKSQEENIEILACNSIVGIGWDWLNLHGVFKLNNKILELE